MTENSDKIPANENDMKANSITGLVSTAAVAIALAIFGSAVNTKAQEAGTAKGGGTKLLQLSGGSVMPKAAPTESKAMSCSKCVNDIIHVRDTDSRGGARALMAGSPLTKSVARHGCADCRTEWSIVGHGKAKVDVAAHKCSVTTDGLAGCNTSTKAKKFEVAPIK